MEQNYSLAVLYHLSCGMDNPQEIIRMRMITFLEERINEWRNGRTAQEDKQAQKEQYN